MSTESQPVPKLQDRLRQNLPVILAAVIVAGAVLAAGWLSKRESAVSFPTEYQAVLLTSGQVYYGRLEGFGTSHPRLNEVYYVQSAANPQTREQANILLKRGKEWHTPDRMYLNPDHILMVEPVGPNSRVAQLIKALKAQN